MVSEWRSVIAVSLNVGDGVRFIKPAKLYMCMQIHYKHDEGGRTVPGVRSHGSVPLTHSGNVVTRLGLHTYIHFFLSLSFSPFSSAVKLFPLLMSFKSSNAIGLPQSSYLHNQKVFNIKNN